MEKHLASYGGGVWAVLNNIFDERGDVQLTHAEGYLELLPKHSNLHLWLHFRRRCQGLRQCGRTLSAARRAALSS